MIAPISYPAAIDKASERSAPGSDNDLAGGSPPTHYRRIAALAIAIFLAAMGGLFVAARLMQTPAATPVSSASTLPSIAVLPFSDFGDSDGYAYFAQGITADLTTELSKLSGLFVISPFSAQGYSATPNSVAVAAENLGVRYLVTGMVQRDSDRIRVNIQLTDGAKNTVLWSERFDGELDDVFAIQDRIVAQINPTCRLN